MIYDLRDPVPLADGRPLTRVVLRPGRPDDLRAIGNVFQNGLRDRQLFWFLAELFSGVPQQVLAHFTDEDVTGLGETVTRHFSDQWPAISGHRTRAG